MKRNIFICSFLQILCLLFASSMYAEANEKSLLILLKSNIRISIPITEQPKITFDGTIMSVGESDYQIDNVQKWMVVAQEAVGIEDVIVITPQEKGAKAKVYNAAGVEMPVSVQLDSNGRIQCDLRTLTAGVYVIQIGKETIKVTKR